nr:DUF1858 domain-containing protein [Candidatus Krumholzibacteria bacterium]
MSLSSTPVLSGEMTLFTITDKHPETIDVFVANGYEHMAVEEKRQAQGKMVTLAQAVQMKGKDLAAFTRLLENAIAENRKQTDVTLDVAEPESQIFPT